MILSFYNKNELWDKEGVDFVRPNEDEVIIHYMGTDVFDRPFVNDIVILEGELYKVFKTIVDYRQKEIYIIVERL